MIVFALGAKFLELVHVVVYFCRVWPCLTCFCFRFVPLSMLMLALCVIHVWSTILECYIRKTKVVVLLVLLYLFE
jgi:hypothetical protein